MCILAIDLDGLRIQSESGARMGYTGKQVIHPGQIEVVQNAFLPSPARIEWATGLLTAFNAHQKNGKVTIMTEIYYTAIKPLYNIATLTKIFYKLMCNDYLLS